VLTLSYFLLDVETTEKKLSNQEFQVLAEDVLPHCALRRENLPLFIKENSQLKVLDPDDVAENGLSGK
jgi:hypothetical protein